MQLHQLNNLAMMVMHLPLNLIGQSIFELELGNENVDGQTDGQTNGQKNGHTNRRNYTNFERNLTMMVIYVPVKYEFDWTNRFPVRVQKRKCGLTHGWTEKRTKNGQTNRRNYTNFERNLAMMVIYVPVKFEFDWTNHFRVRARKRKCGWTDE